MATDDNTTQSATNNTSEFMFADRQKDLAVIERWAKEEVFIYVKWLYKPKEDLAVGSRLYKLFTKKVSNRLSGLHGLSDERTRNMYLQSIWIEANDKRNKKISTALHSRRSGVYTVMQNRFSGMCK